MVQPAYTIENSFVGGLKTEFTGLNFPENSVTDTDNCVYNLTGEVTRRGGFDFEDNYSSAFSTNVLNQAFVQYKWNNAGGDGNVQLVVVQIGGTIYFYQSSSLAAGRSLSGLKLNQTVSLSSFLAQGSVIIPDQIECQFADGNGYLFVFHPALDPFYCTFSGSFITTTKINVQIRDFAGIPDNFADNYRPVVNTNEHLYNLYNQGWSDTPAWSSTSSTTIFLNTPGSYTFTIGTGLTITGGDPATVVDLGDSSRFASGTVTSYTSGTGALVLNITSVSIPTLADSWAIYKTTGGIVGTWHTANLNYPSNSDVWWLYKTSAGVYDPATVKSYTTSSGPAPKGYYILNAFMQQRSALSGVAGITDITTTVRPRTGCWFQGRAWYSGVDAAVIAQGDAPYTAFTENIYFSQIIENPSQFGKCYQVNDPTSESLFSVLPTDGGVIKIQGCGSIYKLYPIQNGLFVFAANGIWFITGSQGLGFTATDYTITKISSIQSTSGTSFVDVFGYPMFWNREGIYMVESGKDNVPYGHGGFNVTNLCLGTILSFYNSIPLISKKYARGAFDPINYIVQWVYRDTAENGLTDRYSYNKILCFNIHLKAFYTYTLPIAINSASTVPNVNGILYVDVPSETVAPKFKYLTTYAGSSIGDSTRTIVFSEEKDFTNFVDFFSKDGVGINYVSSFTTGYRIHGGAIKKFQSPYIVVFSRNLADTAYQIQAIWDFSIDGSSGRESNVQSIGNNVDRFGMVYRRHRLRGNGLSLQIRFISTDGLGFDIMGWSTFETGNMTV